MLFRAYEAPHHPLLTNKHFALRLLSHSAVAGLVVLASLALGMLGYMAFEQMSVVDAFLNAAMILGGMGPVKTLGLSEAGKVFAGCYALYSGLVLIAVMGILLAPVVHRVLHHFHWTGSGGR